MKQRQTKKETAISDSCIGNYHRTRIEKPYLHSSSNGVACNKMNLQNPNRKWKHKPAIKYIIVYLTIPNEVPYSKYKSELKTQIALKFLHWSDKKNKNIYMMKWINK